RPVTLPVVECPCIRVDGFLIVVQHNQNIKRGIAEVVERLEGHAARQRPVADHGNMGAIYAPALVFDRKTHDSRNGCGGMAGAKCVVGTLAAVGEPAYAMAFSVVLKTVGAIGKDLVCISL